MTCTTGGSTFEAKAINEEASGYAEAFMSGDQAFTDIKTENKNGKKLLIFKESYGNAFAPYMIDYYEEIIVIDIRQETASIASIIDEYGITDALIINNVQGALSLRENLPEQAHLLRACRVPQSAKRQPGSSLVGVFDARAAHSASDLKRGAPAPLKCKTPRQRCCLGAICFIYRHPARAAFCPCF